MLAGELIEKEIDLPLSNLNRGDTEIIDVIKSEDITLVVSIDEGELLRWHNRLGHLSRTKLILFVFLNFVPRRLANFRKYQFQCCTAAQILRIPTCTKRSYVIRNIQVTDRPGQYVSVGQMECSEPGFVA